MRLFIQVPRLCWLTPMHHTDITLSLGSAKYPASCSRAATESPLAFATYSGV